MLICEQDHVLSGSLSWGEVVQHWTVTAATGRLIRYGLPAGLAIGLVSLVAFSECTGRDGQGYWKFASVVFLYCITLTSLAVLLTRRFAFSLALTVAVGSAIFATSATKYDYLQTKLAAHDLYFHLADWAEIEFFLAHYSRLAVVAGVALCFVLAFLLTIWRLDATRVARPWAILMLCGCAALSEYTARQIDETYLYASAAALNGRYLSGFFLSTRIFVRTIGEPFRIPRSPTPVKAASMIPAIDLADNEGKRPHIIAILHESSVDPSIYFRGDRYKVPQSFFTSGDGQRRRLSVHIWGGRTWVSEYGFLLGLDVSYFGERSGVLGVLAAGAFQNTLPQELKRLGYTTIANYPSPPSFMNTDRFYSSIGFDVLNEPKDMGLFIRPMEGGRPRDRQYYEFLMKDLDRRGTSKPLFYFVWTTATHGPYSNPEFPTERTEEVVPGDEAAEFARRQRFAAADLAWFEATLRTRFPNEKFLLVGFGDHHPYVAGAYFNAGLQDQGHEKSDSSEDMFKTYYRIVGVNFAPAYDQLPPAAEIGFLGEIVMQAARLPAGPSVLARRSLRVRCSGQWAKCNDQNAVLEANTELSQGVSSLFTRREAESR